MGFTERIVVGLVVLFYVFPLWRISRKMGYPGLLAIPACLPGINLLLAYFLAFTQWPLERELDVFRHRGGR